MKRYKRWLVCLTCACGVFASAGTAGAAAPMDTAVPVRGVVEGFYGTPWTQADRLAMLDFMKMHQLNLYIYAPKDDPYHREKWRQPYPQREMMQLQTLLQKARQDDVGFVYAIAPGLDMHFQGAAGDADLEALLAKFESLYRAGVRQFAIFFDDIQNKDAESQVRVLNAVNARFVHQKADVKPLFTVPTEYFSADMVEEGTVKPYTKAFASQLDQDILVMYTGPGVVCEGISLQDIEMVEKVYGRKMAVWWNYPVTDYMRGKLALGPVTGMAPGLSSHLAAFLMNPMEHAKLSEITLATGADYALQPAAYEAEAAWQKAIAEQYGALAADMQTVAVHSQRLENNWAHVGRQDAPVMRTQMDAFWRALEHDQDGLAEEAVLHQAFQALQQAAQHVQAGLPGKERQEADAQLQLLINLAKIDDTVLSLLRAQKNGQPVAETVLYQRFQKERAALPPVTQTAISEQTAGAFWQEAAKWYAAHKE